MNPIALLIALLLSLLTGGPSTSPASNAPPAAAPGSVSPTAQSYAIDDVVKALKAAGLEASATGEEIAGEAFGTKGKIVKIGSEAMQVYVYASATDQEAVKISPDGFSVEYKGQVSMVGWIAKPHFARKGNLLVTFATRDEELATKVTAAVENMK